jgi:hypothetical protein
MTFESTLPMGAADWCAPAPSAATIDDDRRGHHDDRITTRLSSLNPSLHQDLLRFEQKRPAERIARGDGRRRAPFQRRHGAPAVHEHVIALTVFPVHRLVHCAAADGAVLRLQLTELEVLRVEKAHMQVPDLQTLAQSHVQAQFAPLGKLLWELSLRGSRDELLPEIAGQAAYRITPTVDLSALELTGSLASACDKRCKRQTTSLREIAEWPGFDRPRAMRMLNGLYLQAGLMVSRTHPAATNEGWFSGSR